MGNTYLRRYNLLEMSNFTQEQYQRAFDVQSLGRIVFVAELTPIIFEVDTDEIGTHIGYLTKEEKAKTKIFHQNLLHNF